MSLISKLLQMWLAERTVTSTTPLFMRLLAAIAAIAVLTAMASALLALLMAGALYIIYEQLLQHGLSQQLALLMMISFVLILLGIMAIIAQNYIDRIRMLSRRITARPAPVTGGISTVANAFIRGLCIREPIYRR